MNALLIGCSDGRIAEPLAGLQQEAGILDADRLLVPGGPLVLTRPGMERRVALEAIRSLLEAHDIRHVHVVSHQHCDAYARVLGGLGFDQQELLERDLRSVGRLLENTFSGVEVHSYMIPWRENGNGAGFSPAVLVD